MDSDTVLLFPFIFWRTCLVSCFLQFIASVLQDMATRTEDEVKELLQQASLNEEDLLPQTQVLHFPKDFLKDQNHYVLMELDPSLLTSFQEGQSAVLRGDPEDSAVLCTNNKTYEVRGALTSNTVLLVPELRVPSVGEGAERTLAMRQVATQHHEYWELVPCKPRLHKLDKLLQECPFEGQKDEDEDGLVMDIEEMTQVEPRKEGKKYSLSDLLDRIQCSEEELDEGLKALEAYHIYGFWQILNFDYKFKAVSRITNLIQERHWPLDAIPHDEALLELSKNEPRTVMTQCFEYYLEPTHIERDDGDALYALKGDKVCRLYGEVILKSTSGMELPEFLNMWELSVPEGLATSLTQLNGLILLDKSKSTPIITYFPVSDLPLDVRSRFEQLFDVQNKWTYEEIEPYLEDLADSKNPVTTLLMKNARASTINGKKYYSGKYATIQK